MSKLVSITYAGEQRWLLLDDAATCDNYKAMVTQAVADGSTLSQPPPATNKVWGPNNCALPNTPQNTEWEYDFD